MLLTGQSARHLGLDRALGFRLAVVAGAVNVVGFRAFGLFSANMTGNVSALSLHLARAHLAAALLLGLVLLAFLAGAAGSTLLVEAGKKRSVDSVFAIGLLIEAAGLATLGGLALLVPSLDRPALLVPALAFLMGLQNAITTQISRERVRTTHLSGIITDLGIGLGLLARRAAGRTLSAEGALVLPRFSLYLVTASGFLAGGVLGGGIYDRFGLVVLPLAALLLLWHTARGLR